MRALVTGGGGFLGKAICERLRARGFEVRSLARGAHPQLAALGVEAIRGDVSDTAAVEAAAAGCDVVFHTAARAGVWGRPDEYFRTNVLGTQAVLAACRAQGVSRLVYTSSPSVVFGEGDLRGVDERVPYPERYLTDYPRTKAIAERMVLAANGPGLSTTSIRPHLVWGPGDPHLVPRIVARARAGKLRRVGDGRWLVDTIYVDNAADAHVLAAEALSPRSPAAGRAYFVSQDDPIEVGTMIDRICEAAGLPPVRRAVPAGVAYAAGAVAELAYRALGRAEEPMMTRFLAKQLSTHHHFDIGAIKRDMGYRPAVSLDEGMTRLGVWLRSAEGLAATGG
jgi:2-alkyl-3-oxoalkanoate reductase